METFAYGLGIVDYLLIGIVLLIFVATGVFFNRRDRNDETVRNYLLGNKLMSVLPVAISVVATRYNAIGMTGGVGEVYSYGVEFTIAKYASGLGNVLAAFVIIPVFHGMDYVSMYEYMEKRFSRTLRLIFAAIYLIGETIYMSLVLYVPAVSLSTVTGISLWVSLFGSGLICIFYSTLGGTKAVIWTDVIQTLLMVGCFLMIIVKGTIDVGSPAKVWDLAVAGKRVTTYTLYEKPTTRYSVWSLLVDGLVMSIATLVTKQAVVQRFLSVKDKAAARSVTFLSAWVTMFFAVLVGAAGVVVYANYYNCDPITDKNTPLVKTADQILVFFASTSLHLIPGLQGLAIAGIFSGSLSTMSSFINSFAAITVEDFIKIMNPNWLNSDRKSVMAYKVLTVVYGLIAIGLAFIFPQMGGIIKMASTVKGATVGPLFGILLLGMLFKRANNKGAIFGLLLGLALNLWIIIGSIAIKKKNPPLPISTDGCNATAYQDMYEYNNHTAAVNLVSLIYNATSNATLPKQHDGYSFPLYNISFMWFGPLATASTLILGILASLITGGNKNVDERLLSPVIWKRPRSRSNSTQTMDLKPMDNASNVALNPSVKR